MSRTKEIEKKIEGKEWEEAIDKAYQKANQKVRIDGFRKGKAPKSMFIKKYGQETLWMDAADLVIEKLYSEMIEEEKDILEQLVARPDMTVKKMDEKGLVVNFILTLRPEVKLGKYKGLDVKKEKAKVSKKEIEEAIDSMRQRYAESVLKEGKIVNGDTAIIDFEGFVDGVAFEGGKGENYSLVIGSGSFIPGFEEQLVGLKAGDEKDVVVTFPKDYHAEDLKGKEATFKVKIEEVKETVVPELNEDFFADLAMDGVNSKETLEAEISEHLLEHKEHDIENKYMDALLEEAAKGVEVDIPDVMISEEIDRMMREYEQNLQSQGLNLEMFYKFTNSDENALREQMSEEAIKRVKYRLMLEEIAKAEKIEVSDKDAEEEAAKLAERYQIEKGEFLKMFGGLDMVKYDVKMRRAMEIIKGEEK
ncbi:MAG: trigger factor [Bacilli bacterium]|nr:trigger factor [Bacilli bacterium]